MRNLSADLNDLKRQHRYRRRRVVDLAVGTDIVIDGSRISNFSSNDYLGLSQHPEVIRAMQRGVEQYGAGSGAAHLITGHSKAHHLLEEELAELTGYPRALLFSTGYMANLGTITSLIGKGDAVFEDRLNHASLIDGGLMSGARLQRYQHGDIDSLRNKLSSSKAQERLVITDGVFSMDGDIAPLPELAKVTSQNDAWLMVDDAHGFGILGKRGAGSVAHFMLQDQVPIYMATLGKAAGVFGAFVAGSEELVETLIQRARSYIYTTAIPPAVAEALRASLKIIQNDNERREQLHAHIKYFRSGASELGLQLLNSPTAIQPILVGSNEATVEISRRLFDAGFAVSAIRPPTVPEGSARLRITLSANHSEEQIDKLLDALHQCCPTSEGSYA
ncbi:MAG: 8-amino-7-oxononanoate synthase [Gammaproteobacteria bacterium]|nr:8-amino-7-oxononanoate synthase [Gammaproteobacteria bacterium]